MIDYESRLLAAERLQVIEERKSAFTRWANCSAAEKARINSEFIRPLNDRLLTLNKRLGL